ncbi:MAG: hypothetical protein AB1428_13135 [Bacteroidota bacterium]
MKEKFISFAIGVVLLGLAALAGVGVWHLTVERRGVERVVTRWYPDTLDLHGAELVIDSLKGRITSVAVLLSRERRARFRAEEQAGRLAALLDVLSDTSSDDLPVNLPIAQMPETTVTLRAEADSADATMRLHVGVSYDIARDLWRDFHASVDTLTVRYLRAYTTRTVSEPYIAWGWVVPIAAVIAALTLVITK